MIFKKLELIGFKSFAEKTTLVFEPGITAVVGPNGCGKSNIIDGIKWVLGEQSIKSLRGSKMEDVIFNGTEEKEPINMAEVSLTLSNKDKILPVDSDEVVVSRKIFRSGESEYLINKAPVRLKDVTDLLMGTGMGAEMYSIIEQGKIGLILSTKPEERRYIFEEASGITRYKSRKRETIRKLEETDNNLLRVNDIITEVKRQIDSITRQAKKAERYKERFDRLKELEIKLASYEYALLKKEIDGIETKSSQLKQKIEALASESDKLRLKLDEEKKYLAQIDEKFSELQNSKFSRESQIGQNRHRAGVDKERIVELSARVTGLRAEIQAIEARKVNTRKLVDDLESRFQVVSDSQETKAEIVKEEEKRLENLESEIRNNEKLIEETKEKIVDYMAERSKSRNEVIRLTSDIQNRSARLRRLDAELGKVREEVNLIKEKLDAVRKEFDGAELRLGNIRSERDRLEKEKEGLASALDSLEKTFESERNSLIALESKKSFIEDLIARYEGYEAGVKAILESQDRLGHRIDGIKGVLGNMIRVKRGYEHVVEAGLGDYVQSIVSQDRQSAIKAAEYLTAESRGRATFLILDELQASENYTGELPQIEGVIGRLADYINAPQELKNAVADLMKDVYLVENREAAERVISGAASIGRREIKLVTKNGEIFKRGFIAAGRTPKGEDAGIIGREARLKETIESIETSKIKIGALEKDKNGLESKLAELNKKIQDIDELMKEEELEYHKKESKLVSIDEAHRKLEEESSLLNLEKDEVGEEIKNSALKKDELEKRVKEIDAEENNTQNCLLNSQVSVKNYYKEREEVVVIIASIKTEVQALAKEKTSLSQNLDLQRELYQTYSDSLQQKTAEVDSSLRKSEELSQEIEELASETLKLDEELKTVTIELKEIYSRKSGSASSIEEGEKHLTELYRITNENKDAEHNYQMKKSEICFKIETLKNRMAQLYKVDVDAEKPETEPSLDWDAVRREIEELNRRLEAMGTVNLVAIEEHKELEERFNFLSSQRDDLLKAREDLQTAIAKINKTARKLFIETFEKIQVEFKNYFRYLFGGGQAEVFLLDGSDVLESGIEIVARPPGKKLQNISLLSGGEKALTAIALIFAIFKVKPSPFCLLDEVDAPLDEANIDRFSKALLEFTKKSQFIVITHNKKTITLADVMYGITMEKSGISKIVSVKFHDEAKAKKEAEGKGTVEKKEEEILTKTKSGE